MQTNRIRQYQENATHISCAHIQEWRIAKAKEIIHSKLFDSNNKIRLGFVLFTVFMKGVRLPWFIRMFATHKFVE